MDTLFGDILPARWSPPPVSSQEAAVASATAQLDNDENVYKGGRVFADMTDEERLEDRLDAQIHDVLPKGPPSMIRRLMQTFYQFGRLHKGDGGIARGQLEGKERRTAGIATRFREYIGRAVRASIKMDKITNTPILHPTTKKKQYMSLSALKKLKQNVFRLLDFVPYPPMTPQQLKDTRTYLDSWTDYLRKKYDITDPFRTKRILQGADIRVLIECAFKRAKNKDWDLVIQYAMLFLTFLYTGARPACLLEDDDWPGEHLNWGAYRFMPVRDEDGKTIAFDVKVVLSDFKGYHDGKRLKIPYTIRTVQSANHTILDYGNISVAHGLRSKAFGSRTLADLRATKATEFKCDPEFDNVPVFRARTSRNALGQEPMTTRVGNQVLRDWMRNAGMVVSPYESTLYCIRRGLATNMVRNIGERAGKYYMAHKPNSTMLEEFYDQSLLDINMTEGVLGPTEARTMVITPLSASRATEAIPAVMVTLEEALQRHPEYRHISSKLQYLEACLASGSSAWMSIQPYNDLPGRKYFNQGHLIIFTRRYKSQLDLLIQRLQAKDQASLNQQEQQAADERDYDIIRARREEAAAPSTLARDLQARLLKRELTLLTGEAREEGGNEDEVEEVGVEVMGFGDDDEAGEDDMVEEDDDEAMEGNVAEDQQYPAPARDDELVSDEEEEKDLYRQRRGDPSIAVIEVDDEDEDEDGDGGDPEADRAIMEGAEKEAEVQVQDLPEFDIDGDKMQLLDLFTAIGVAERPCESCIDDETVSVEDKNRIWDHDQVSKLVRHQLSFHSDHQYISRWFKFHTPDGKFTCPFCPKTYQAAYKPSVSMRRHLVEEHSGEFTPGQLLAVDEDTRGESQRAAAQAVQDHTGYTAPTKAQRDAEAVRLAATTSEMLQAVAVGLIRGPEMMRFMPGVMGVGTDLIPPGLWDDSDGSDVEEEDGDVDDGVSGEDGDGEDQAMSEEEGSEGGNGSVEG